MRIIKHAYTAIAIVLAVAPDIAGAEKLDFERLRADPPLTGTTPRSIAVAPDGARVTWLQPRSDNQDMLDLWQFERVSAQPRLLLRQEDLIADTLAELTPEEQALRQRLRIRAGGITRYAFDNNGERLLIPLSGNLYVYEFDSATVTEIAGDQAFTNPKLSPDGSAIAFVRDRNLWARNLRTGEETALTDSGGDTIVNGLAEFIAQEEMGRYDGFWWSPDSSQIAFIEYDEAEVPVLERVAIGGDGASISAQRYALAGAGNIIARIGVISRDGGPIVWADLPANVDTYIARVDWSEDGAQLYAQLQPRSQQRLDLFAIDPADGTANVLITETTDSWINLHDDFWPLPDGSFLWSSERTGYRHIYHYSDDVATVRALTAGDWLVDEIECVDFEARQIYFSGWMDDPLTTQLYRVDLAGSATPERISSGPGVHAIAAARDCSLLIDSYSAPDQPSQVSMRDREGQRIAWLFENRLDAEHPYAPYLDTHAEPEFGVLEAEDGTPLHYRMYRPSDFDPGLRYPVIASVYGGPGVQSVRRNFGSLTDQVYADAGFVVFALDNRGSTRRGVEFEAPLFGRLGDVEVRDQLAGVRFLRSLPFVDADRIGVTGWSYGGYMSLMLLARAEGQIAAAVAGAPVTDWRLYDTHYTERYLGLPDTNADGYEQSAVFPYLGDIEGHLLLIHGMADDNVFFTNATKLMQALQQSNQPFELMTYPGETHFISNRAARLHADLTALHFLERYLN